MAEYAIYDRLANEETEITEEEALAIVKDADLCSGPFGCMGYHINQYLCSTEDEDDPIILAVCYEEDWLEIPTHQSEFMSSELSEHYYKKTTWGGAREGSGRKPVEEPRKPRAFRLTDKEYATAKEIINLLKEGENMTPSKYYESVGDSLKGVEATRAYRAAQNHLQETDPDYMEDWKRLQDKIIKSLEEGSETK